MMNVMPIQGDWRGDPNDRDGDGVPDADERRVQANADQADVSMILMAMVPATALAMCVTIATEMG